MKAHTGEIMVNEVVQVSDDELVSISPKTKAAFEKLAEQTYLTIQKRDYRATLVHREESGDVPDSAAALIHIDESQKDENNNPIELDVKGHITPYEAMMFKDVNYAQALVRLKNWAYFEEPEYDRVGNLTGRVVRTPINLAQIDMLSKKRLNLGIEGRQAYKHINERRANAGMLPEESLGSKVSGWAGFKKEKISKEEIEEQYGKR